MAECGYLQNCRFFELMQASDLKDIAPELVSLYCRGPFMSVCRRKQSIELGIMPGRDLSPTGISFNF